MTIRKLCTCKSCGKTTLFDFVFEESFECVTVAHVSVPCPECCHEVEYEPFTNIQGFKLIKVEQN